MAAEPENAYLRNVLRQLAVRLRQHVETFDGDEDDRARRRADIRSALQTIEETLARPRTNDATIDRLERRVADLESKAVDDRILRHEKATAEFVADEMRRQRDAALSELAAVRSAIRPRARPVAEGLDQPDARFLADLGAQIRAWADQGMVPVRGRAAELESELVAIAAALQGRPTRELEERAVEAAADRERLLYWLCWIAKNIAPTFGEDNALVTVLAEFGVDTQSIAARLQAGEPGRPNGKGGTDA